jgi:peptide/nickel transport system substrate-binding protein
MLRLKRRGFLIGGGVAVGSVALPRFAIAQADNRPTITLAVQQISTAATLEPLRERSNVAERSLAPIFESLIARDMQSQLEPIPGLAESWTRIDARTVEFSLRKGVKFHNGDEMTADDVAFSFGPERMFGPSGTAGRTLYTTAVGSESIVSKVLPAEVVAVAKRIWPTLERVEAVAKYTVRVVTRVPDIVLEGRLAGPTSEIVSQRAYSEAKTWIEWARRPVSTGPYKVRDYQADRMLILDAHDDYWGGRPPIKAIRFMVVPEVASRVNGLLSGEFDFAFDIPPDQIPEIEKYARFEVQGGLIPNHRITAFDKTHPQLADPRVRQAMSHAIDRQAIVDSLWAGRTRIPPGLQWEFYGPMFIEGWTVPEYDPKKAQQLLKATGYKGDPIPFRVLNNYYTNQVATAQILVEMWRGIGLNVQIAMRENWQQIFERDGNRAVRDWSNSALIPDPIGSMVGQHGPEGQQQQVQEWTNAEMNALCVAYESEIDMAKRKAMFRRMLQIAEREDPALTVLHQTATFTAKRKDIAWKAAPAFQVDFSSRNFQLMRKG